MATLTAVAGGGNFMTAATWSPAQQPTAADDCILNAASGAVTVDAGSLCRSLDANLYASTLTHTAGVTLTIGDGTAGLGNIALRLGTLMTYTLGNVATSAISFVSTSATQQTITSAGKTRGNTTYSGAGSSYVLTDATTIGATATWTLSAGTFSTANFAMSLGLVLISGATAKTLTLGSSAIAITGNNNQAVVHSGSNCTFTANTAVMTFSGLSGGINGGNWNGTSLVFTSAVANLAALRGGTNALTVANVTYNGPATKTGAMQIVDNTAITGTLTVTGNSTVNRVFVSSGVVGTVRTATVTTGFSFTNVDFMDITAAGVAGTWTGTSMGNALGNTNITFDAPATQTHTATAGGNWSDVTKWTSRVPLPQDNVVVDVNTTGTLTADMPRLGADITFTGFAGTAAFNSVALTAYGSLTLGAGMAFSGANNLTLAARSAKTITGNGALYTPGVLTINAPSGTYTLTGPLSTNAMSVTLGTFVTAGFAFSPGSFAMSGAATTIVDITNSTVNLAATSAVTWNVVNAATVLTATGSTIVISTASASARTFGGASKTYGTLTYTVAGSTGSLAITGANTFTTINFSDATNGRSLLFTPATTTTVTSFNVFGTAGKLMTVDSATAATHTLTKPTGTVSTDYLSIKNSLAGGGAYWYAGANSVDAGGNSGWKFSAPPTDGATQFFFALDNAGGGGAQ